MNPSEIERGMRVLLWPLVILLAIAAIGSAAFATGRFDHFPYAWF